LPWHCMPNTASTLFNKAPPAAMPMRQFWPGLHRRAPRLPCLPIARCRPLQLDRPARIHDLLAGQRRRAGCAALPAGDPTGSGHKWWSMAHGCCKRNCGSPWNWQASGLPLLDRLDMSDEAPPLWGGRFDEERLKRGASSWPVLSDQRPQTQPGDGKPCLEADSTASRQIEPAPLASADPPALEQRLPSSPSRCVLSCLRA